MKTITKRSLVISGTCTLIHLILSVGVITFERWDTKTDYSGNDYPRKVPVVECVLFVPLIIALEKTPLHEIPFKGIYGSEQLLVWGIIIFIHSIMWGAAIGFIVTWLSGQFS